MQVPDHENIDRQDPAAEQRREVEKESHFIAILEIFTIQDIARHRGDEQSAERAGDRDKNRYAIGLDNVFRIFEQQVIGCIGQFFRQDAVTIFGNVAFRRKRP